MLILLNWFSFPVIISIIVQLATVSQSEVTRSSLSLNNTYDSSSPSTNVESSKKQYNWREMSSSFDCPIPERPLRNDRNQENFLRHPPSVKEDVCTKAIETMFKNW